MRAGYLTGRDPEWLDSVALDLSRRGLTHGQIAERTGVRTGTVSRRIKRAILRECGARQGPAAPLSRPLHQIRG